MNEKVSQMIAIQIIKLATLKKFLYLIVSLSQRNAFPFDLNKVHLVYNFTDTAWWDPDEFSATVR